MAAHGGEAFGCDIGAAEPLGNGDDAFRHRDPGIDRVIARLDRQPAHLGRAAANVEQQHPRRIGRDQRRCPGNCQTSLGLAIDHLELETGLLGHLVDEGFAVRRHPARLGGDQPEAVDLPPAQLVGADPQGGDRAWRAR